MSLCLESQEYEDFKQRVMEDLRPDEPVSCDTLNKIEIVFQVFFFQILFRIQSKTKLFLRIYWS